MNDVAVKLLRSCQTVFRTVSFSSLPSQQYMKFLFVPHPLQHLNFRYSKVHCGFNLHYPSDKSWGTNFHVLNVVSFSLLMKCLSKSFAYFKIRLFPNYRDLRFLYIVWGASQVVLVVKNTPANTGGIRNMGLMPGLGRSPGGKHSNPLQYSCLENTREKGAQQATVHRVANSQT